MGEGFMKVSEMLRAGISTGIRRLPDASLYLLHALRKVGVAGIEIAECGDDGDYGLAGEFVGGISHLCQSRAMAEGSQVVVTQPAVTAELFGGFANRRSCCHDAVGPLVGGDYTESPAKVTRRKRRSI